LEVILGAFLFAGWILSGIACAMIANGKHRKTILWFIFGLLLPWISVFIVMILPGN
jgi:hypothetical protein